MFQVPKDLTVAKVEEALYFLFGQAVATEGTNPSVSALLQHPPAGLDSGNPLLPMPTRPRRRTSVRRSTMSRILRG